MSKKIEITNSDLVKIEPVTDNQKVVFESYKKGQNQFLYGCAGTGKTFMALYLALRDVLNEDTPYDKVYIVRSLVATREIGFLRFICLGVIPFKSGVALLLFLGIIYHHSIVDPLILDALDIISCQPGCVLLILFFQ